MCKSSGVNKLTALYTSDAADNRQLRQGDDSCAEVCPASVKTSRPQRSLNVTSTRVARVLVHCHHRILSTVSEVTGSSIDAPRLRRRY